MRKSVVFLLAALCGAGAIPAQDTVRYGDAGYLFPPSVRHAFRAERFWLQVDRTTEGVTLVPYYPADTEWVVGVAIVMDTLYPQEKPQATLWQRSVDGQWVMLDTTVWAPRRRKLNYFCLEGDYIDTTTPERATMHYKEVKPLYEFYFFTPHMVTDSFYVGYYYYAYRDCNRRFYQCWPSRAERVQQISDSILTAFYADPRFDTTYSLYYEHLMGWGFPCVFPIVWRRGAVSAADEAGGRMEWQVRPNPATEGAEVLCDRPMEWVELLTAGGAVVERHNAAGTSCRLDLEGLPAGIYLVRIGTADGLVATRKLVRP